MRETTDVRVSEAMVDAGLAASVEKRIHTMTNSAAMRHILEAAFAALDPAPKCEWVTVPKDPTDEMQNAARDWSIETIGHAVGYDGSRGCYQAMLAAAPTAPSADSAQDVGELVRALERTLAAIKTGRNEPLEIAREDITNVLAAYKRSATDGKS